jgi:hypothetical protein
MEKKCVTNMVFTKFNMYRYHFRKINKKKNYGWLRNIFYNISQQLMRQNPVYYAYYITFRQDGAWRLVSYSYYVKYALLGNNTFFRYIDINIPRFFESKRDKHMI